MGDYTRFLSQNPQDQSTKLYLQLTSNQKNKFVPPNSLFDKNWLSSFSGSSRKSHSSQPDNISTID